MYLMGGKLGIPCCKMPIPLKVCRTCGCGIKQTRGWTWVDPRPWLQEVCVTPFMGCAAAEPEGMGDRVGLLWIGTAFYKTPEDFIREAGELGISRRITTIPRGFKLGESWVFLAHPKVFRDTEGEWSPGIFRIFKPTAIEKIVTKTQSEDADEMEALAERGITPVIVPDDDPDHQGSVYDREEAGAEQLELAC
jgi:hypothetical protein